MFSTTDEPEEAWLPSIAIRTFLKEHLQLDNVSYVVHTCQQSGRRFVSTKAHLAKRPEILPEGKIIAREGTKIFSTNDEEIGTITSGTFGPSVNAPVAMGYIDPKFSEIGANIQVEVRGKKHSAQISKLAFYKKSYVK